MKQTELISAAWDARENAYADYSHFKVGAAVETADGRIYKGCNVENASYSLTQCAERTALFAAVADGVREFRQLVVATENGVSPCGACRQVIWELCGDIPVILVDQAGTIRKTRSSDLLPLAFGADDLDPVTPDSTTRSPQE